MKRVFVGITVAVVLVVAVGVGRFLAPSTRQWPPQSRHGRLVGVIEGTVKRLDQPAGIIDVASGVFGLGSVRLAVGPETTVTVGDRQGGLANAERGRFVRVTYEVQSARLVAWRIDVVDERARASDLVVSHLIAEVAAAVAPVAAVRVDEAVPVSPPAVLPPAPLADAPAARPLPPSPSPRREISRRPPTRRPVASRPPTLVPAAPLPAILEPLAAPPSDRGVTTEPDLPFPATAPPRAESTPLPVLVPTRVDQPAPRVDRPPGEKNAAVPPPRPREPTRAPQLP
jgi:hypothetical protein